MNVHVLMMSKLGTEIEIGSIPSVGNTQPHQTTIHLPVPMDQAAVADPQALQLASGACSAPY